MPDPGGNRSHTTPEDRIRAQWKARKFDPRNETVHVVFMQMARTWRRPIAEIRNIIGYRGRTDWERQDPTDSGRDGEG